MNNQEILEETRKRVYPGKTLYTVLRHVSSSGASRDISVLSLDEMSGDRLDITQFDYAIEQLLGCKMSKRGEGNRVTGGGMNMGFHLVYSLSRVLFPDGFDCTGDFCPSNDHSNGAERDGKMHHNDGGYALKQRWL